MIMPVAESEGVVDLDAPVMSDRVLEVRSGKMQNMEGLTIQSGINKTMCDIAVKVSEMGIEGDEHDYTFHGGIDKAIHAYCCAHYPRWRAEFPASAERFVPGGFGENLVLARMNERNVCIGDVVRVGDSVELQVSLPRQPCFKLNHRFRLKNFAPQTWRHSRTGWYYRVLRPGTIHAGDEVRVLERRHPKWTIERVQEYLHRDTGVDSANKELARVQELGAESGDAFRARVAKRASRERKARLAAEEERQWRPFRLAQRTRQTPRIVSFVLEAVEPLKDKDEIKLDPGAHVKLRLGNGLVRAYSVVSGDRNRFELGVALEPGSRGGSRFLHESLGLGDVLEVGRFTNAVPTVSAASNHVFVAGGVGITAFLALLESFRAINWSAKLHYAVRSADEVPFRDRFEKLGFGDVVVLYDKSAGNRLNIPTIVKAIPWNSQLYFCGPRRMMDEALSETRAAGVGEGEVHFEAFEADVSGDPFEALVINRREEKKDAQQSTEAGGGDDDDKVKITTQKEGVTVQVGPEETLLEVLKRRFGVDEVPSSCEVGNCGTCKIAVLEGRVEHRGTALTEEDKAGAMLSCVSRGIGRIVVEI